MISVKEYQDFASKGLLPATKQNGPLVDFALGLTGESGEVVDLIKKKIFHGRDIPVEEFKKELGDVLWYVANIATEVGLTLEDIMQCNITKLKERYSDLY